MRLWLKFFGILSVAVGLQLWADAHPGALDRGLFTVRVALWGPFVHADPTDEMVDAATQLMAREQQRSLEAQQRRERQAARQDGTCAKTEAGLRVRVTIEG